MYRPNRIGPWSIGDLDKAFVADAKTDFDTHDVTFATYGAYSLNTASGVNFTGETFQFTDSTGVSLANIMQVGIGVQISGADYMEQYMYSISGTLMYDDSTEVMVECVLGRLAAAPSAAASIAVANPITIPITFAKGGSLAIASVNHTLITTMDDGGTPPATEFDICAFWRLTNVSGAATTLPGLGGRIAVHRYAQDLHTFDPTR